MNKKQQGKQQQNQASKAKETKEVKEIQPTPLPAIEDFFTQVLQKKKKPLFTKLDEIAELEQRDRETLKPDQKEKINKKGEIHEKIKYFEDIRLMYLEAHAKKASAGSDQTAKSVDPVVDKVANLFGIGHALHHFEKNAQLLGHTFSSDQMAAIQEAYFSLKNIESAQHLEAAKQRLKAFVSNEELSVATAKFFEEYTFDAPKPVRKPSEKPHETGHHEHHKEQHAAHEQKQHKEEHHHQAKEAHHAHTEHAPRKQSAKVEEKPQKRLFADESDEEEPHHEQQHKKHHKEESSGHHEAHSNDHKQEKEGQEDSMPPGFLVPLPEGDDKKADEFKQRNRRHQGGNRPYKPRNHDGPRPPKPHHEGGEGASQHVEGEKKEQGQAQEGHKQERHREHRPHNDNYRQDGQRKPHRQYQEGEEGERRQYRPRNNYQGGEDQRPYRPRRDYEGDAEGEKPRYYRNQSGRQGEYQESYRPKREHHEGQQHHRRHEQPQQGNAPKTN